MNAPPDMEQICRVCMQSGQQMYLLHDEKHNIEGLTLATVLSNCTAYRVERYDELPHQICDSCMQAAGVAYNFKRQCERSYRELLAIARKSNIEESLLIKMDFSMGEAITKTEKCTQTENTMLYPCERCDEKYFTYDALRVHRENEHKGSAIICRFCGKQFNRIGYLKTHIAVFHPESGYTSHNQCRICKRQFTRREHMRRHLAVIHKIVEAADEDVDEDEDMHLKQEDEETSMNALNIDEVAAEPIEASTNIADCKDKYEPEGASESDSENLFDNNNAEACAMNSDDEDEKPLAKLLSTTTKTTPTKGFIEVLLDENTEILVDTKRIALRESETPTQDVLSAPVKRGRGRPKRLVEQRTATSSASSTDDDDDEDDDDDGDTIPEHNCDECDKSFTRHSALLRHKQLHTGEPRFACKICPKSFTRAEYLKAHMSFTHDAAKVKKCEECDQVFTHITQYKRHKETKHSEKLHKCEICQKSFTTKIYLQRHLTIHEKKRYVCKECSQSYPTREELNGHIKAEGHDKPMLCPECGLRCKTSNILTVHMRRHNGEKPFKCKFCSKGFPRMDDLRIHEKYHTGEKSHFCETCGKGFQRKYNLTIHMRVHTGEKPYKCPHCPQAFAQGNDLKAHIRRHTGERFRCEVCGAAFLQGYQIRQHKLAAHGIKEDPPTQRVAKFTSLEEQEQQIKQILQKELATITTTAAGSNNTNVVATSELETTTLTNNVIADNLHEFLSI